MMEDSRLLRFELYSWFPLQSGILVSYGDLGRSIALHRGNVQVLPGFQREGNARHTMLMVAVELCCYSFTDECVQFRSHRVLLTSRDVMTRSLASDLIRCCVALMVGAPQMLRSVPRGLIKFLRASHDTLPCHVPHAGWLRDTVRGCDIGEDRDQVHDGRRASARVPQVRRGSSKEAPPPSPTSQAPLLLGVA